MNQRIGEGPTLHPLMHQGKPSILKKSAALKPKSILFPEDLARGVRMNQVWECDKSQTVKTEVESVYNGSDVCVPSTNDSSEIPSQMKPSLNKTTLVVSNNAAAKTSLKTSKHSSQQERNCPLGTPSPYIATAITA